MFVKSIIVGGALALLTAGSAFAACDLQGAAAAGKTVSAQCKSCHVFEADKPSRPTGPNLHDVIGRKAAALTDFKYSDAMKGANAKGLVWDEGKVFAYVEDPKKFLESINGEVLKHAMFFNLKDEQKRKDVAAFLVAIKGKPDCN